MEKIRNFSIIAHIDHGKSTLADRMLEATGTIEPRKMMAQVLDSMELEREKGITIKMRPVRMLYLHQNQDWQLNLIDTPGHIDFSYEVSRALKAVEGAVLLVDATQGIQAQTLTTLRAAREQGLVILGAVSKVDSPIARTDEVKAEVAKLLDCDVSEVLETSGKTGQGVPELLNKLIERVPAPKYSRILFVPPFVVRRPQTFRMTSFGEVQPLKRPVSRTPMSFGHLTSHGSPAITSAASDPPTPIASIPRPPALGVCESVPITRPPGKA